MASFAFIPYNNGPISPGLYSLQSQSKLRSTWTSKEKELSFRLPATRTFCLFNLASLPRSVVIIIIIIIIIIIVTITIIVIIIIIIIIIVIIIISIVISSRTE